MKVSILARAQLTAEERQAMYALRARYFCNTCLPNFEHDLESKNLVILLRDDPGNIRGFSTLSLYMSHVLNAPAVTAYSGDTIVAPDAWVWSKSFVGGACIHIGRCVQAVTGIESGHWFTVTCSFRTYRFLPICFRQFHPCHGHVTPPEILQHIHALASERFGDCFDPGDGIVRWTRPQPVCHELGHISNARLRDPHTAFFARQNRAYAQGEELLCWTRFACDNLTPAGHRLANCSPPQVSSEAMRQIRNLKVAQARVPGAQRVSGANNAFRPQGVANPNP